MFDFMNAVSSTYFEFVSIRQSCSSSSPTLITPYSPEFSLARASSLDGLHCLSSGITTGQHVSFLALKFTLYFSILFSQCIVDNFMR